MSVSARAASIVNYVGTKDKIQNKVKDLPEDLLVWQPGPGKWSINEIVGHLLDSNIVNSYRIRKIISEPITPIVTFAHEGWVSQQLFNKTTVEEMLTAYEALTAYNATLLRKLNEEQWQRYGLKGEEPISIAHIVDSFICNHVEKHMGQIDRNIEAYNREER
ncbi:DinB family protein [Paenibacillus glycanilyticus]|uniref:DinB family protein n=1 Tax=Paenibacillus glycanilyticus TaxID=126569 RepID=UPI000FD8C6C1|nr:DinB family protein [Paenibacillus glycanilyticus]